MGAKTSKVKKVNRMSEHDKKINEVLCNDSIKKNNNDIGTGLNRVDDQDENQGWGTEVTARYELKGLIGKGKYSFVYRAEDKYSKRPCAIKRSRKGEAGRKAVLAESNILRTIRHAHIVQLVQEIEMSDTSVILVMELLLGGSLNDRVYTRGGAFSESEASATVAMLLSAVSYLHKYGITHRNITTKNVLYYHPGNESKVLLTGFRLACVRNQGSDLLMHDICGTPEYLAPEVVAKRPYTCAVDVWAIGIMTYFMLTGNLPFHHKEKPKLYGLILRGKYNQVNKRYEMLSDEAKSLISSLLTLDPEERLSAKEALVHPWIPNVTSIPTLSSDESASSDSSSLVSQPTPRRDHIHIRSLHTNI